MLNCVSGQLKQCSDDVITIPHYSGALDLHENLLCIGDAVSNQNKLN